MSAQPVQDGHGLALDRVAKATTKGLRLAPGLPFSTWQRVGEQIRVIGNASCWWIGDWLLYGERGYRISYQTAVRVLGLDYQTLRNYASVAARFPLYRRRDKLSFQHHAEVASLSEAQQELWLHEAQSKRWTRNELRRQLRAARGRPDQEREGGPKAAVVITINVALERERRWRQAASRMAIDLEQWMTTVADAAAEAVLRVEEHFDEEHLDPPAPYWVAPAHERSTA